MRSDLVCVPVLSAVLHAVADAPACAQDRKATP